MATETKAASRTALENRLKWFVAFRLMFATILVVATNAAWPMLGGRLFVAPFRIVLAVTAAHLLAAFVFAVLFRYARPRRLTIFTLLQVFWDLVFTTALVSVSGGIESELKLLYWLPIAFAAILLFRAGAYVAASVSGLFYGTLANLVYFGKFSTLLHTFGPHKWPEQKVTNSIILHTAGCFLAAYLFSYLSVGLKRAEASAQEKAMDLEDLEVLMGRIVESLTSGLVTLDALGRINYWSQVAETITGLKLSEVRGRPFTEIFQDAKQQFAGEIRGGPSPDRPWRWETRYRTRDGAERILGFSVSPLRQEKQAEQGTLIIFQDLTRFREMEEQIKRADRLAALGEIAARMAHEIRNPLTSVSGAIEVLQRRVDGDDDDRRLMQIVLRETDRLNSLLTDFLLFAKPTAPQYEEVAAGDLLKETAELFAKSHERSKLRIETEVQGSVVVHADAKQLSQLFWNLMKNAAEAMPKGGAIRLQLRTDQQNRTVLFEIHDEGTGIPAGIRDQLFQPFFTTKQKGTGLGLAVVKRIAEEHGGTVGVQSAEGEGTTITVRLPQSDHSQLSAVGSV